MIGFMEHAWDFGAVGRPKVSTNSWGATNESNWWIESDRWEQWFATNAPHVMRARHIADEPNSWDWDGDGVGMAEDIKGYYGTDDSVVAWPKIRELCTWLMNNPGDGNKLKRVVVQSVFGNADTPNHWIDGAPNYLTLQIAAGVGGWGSNGVVKGINVVRHSMGEFLNPTGGEEGRWENVSTARGYDSRSDLSTTVRN